MLPERMKKGEWVYDRKRKLLRKIARVKKHPEYDEERVYALEGPFGIVTPTYETTKLQECGFTEHLTKEELVKLYKSGEWMPEKLY